MQNGNIHPQLLDPGRLVRLVDQGREGGPIELARLSALGLGGLVLFHLLVGLVLSGPASATQLLSLWAIPLAMLICFPPLVLFVGLRGRRPDLQGLTALTASGPVCTGLWLGTLSPLIALYGLTGEPNLGFGLLVVLAYVSGLAFGVRAVVQNAQALGANGPGVFVALFHAMFLAWTALVLASRFATGG